MLTRRDFHKSLTGLAFASLAAGPLRAAGDTAGVLTDAQFLNRLTHGVTSDELATLARLGKSGWLDEQLAMPAEDAGLSGRFATAGLWIQYDEGENEAGEKWEAVAELRPLTLLNETPEVLVQLLNWERAIDYSERELPALEVIAASFIRVVHAPAQLREVMTQFWHEHFSVNAMKDETTAALFPPYDAMLRENAFGNFRVMLGEVARSPAMLHYLNNDESSASPANENYARELLELHTLGQDNYFNDIYENWREVPGADKGQAIGYIDADVYEVARALTGWSIGDGRYTSEGAETAMTGRFAYVEAWHDPYQKRVLGHELEAFGGPGEDGDAVLDILAAHPATARFVTTKMLRRMGIENPSQEYRDVVAGVFGEKSSAPDQIGQTVRAIVEHSEFSTTPPEKLRRPFEYLAALYRTTGAEISPKGREMNWRLETAGWSQHRVRPPTGHSDKTEDWADTRTINGMVELARNAHDDWTEITKNILGQVPGGATTLGEMADYWADKFAIPTDRFDTAFEAFESDRGEEVPTDFGDIEWVNQIFVTSAALGPEFLFR